eukprot:768033-Hanusia_phi.AAC.13
MEFIFLVNRLIFLNRTIASRLNMDSSTNFFDLVSPRPLLVAEREALQSDRFISLAAKLARTKFVPVSQLSGCGLVSEVRDFDEIGTCDSVFSDMMRAIVKRLYANCVCDDEATIFFFDSSLSHPRLLSAMMQISSQGHGFSFLSSSDRECLLDDIRGRISGKGQQLGELEILASSEFRLRKNFQLIVSALTERSGKAQTPSSDRFLLLQTSCERLLKIAHIIHFPEQGEDAATTMALETLKEISASAGIELKPHMISLLSQHLSHVPEALRKLERRGGSTGHERAGGSCEGEFVSSLHSKYELFLRDFQRLLEDKICSLKDVWRRQELAAERIKRGEEELHVFQTQLRQNNGLAVANKLRINSELADMQDLTYEIERRRLVLSKRVQERNELEAQLDAQLGNGMFSFKILHEDVNVCQQQLREINKFQIEAWTTVNQLSDMTEIVTDSVLLFLSKPLKATPFAALSPSDLSTLLDTTSAGDTAAEKRGGGEASGSSVQFSRVMSRHKSIGEMTSAVRITHSSCSVSTSRRFDSKSLDQGLPPPPPAPPPSPAPPPPLPPSP